MDGRIQEQWSLIGLIYRLADATGIICGLMVAYTHAATLGGPSYKTEGAAAIIVFYLIAEMCGMYRSWRGIPTDRELICALFTWLSTLAILSASTLVTDTLVNISGNTLFIWFLTAPVMICSCRILIREYQRVLRSHGLNTRRYAVIGATELGFQLARNIKQSPETGLRLVGFFEDRDDDRTPEVPPEFGKCVGSVDEVVEQAHKGSINNVYITLPMRAEDRIKDILQKLSDTTASVYVVPDFFVFELLHSRWTAIGGLPVVSIFEHPFYGVDGFLKRAADVCLTCVALIVAAIPMAIISAAIKLTSPGPVLFRQKRYGLDGREILVWKFRSMRIVEADKDVVQATRNDPRVTPLGKLLRRTSLDELPQLFNVLAGTMSLVGPRPHATVHNEEYRKLVPGYMLRHKVKPGITGLAQVSGWRGEVDSIEKIEGRVRCDHQYIREWSMWMDIKILFQTMFVVFGSRNAY